ncbi:Coiled-coil domain-containing protein 43, partial [Varanus komodoensis]
MAAPCAFELWLEKRLEALGLDADVYGGYIRGVLREAECDAERLEGLMGALAAGESDEEILQEVCKEIVERWSETQNTGTNEKKEDEVQAITNIIEKQAQIVMKPKEVSKEETLQKAALLAQYAELEREHLRDESQRKKEQDKLQREKDKLTKQERKEKEKKRTQKGERKR